MRLDDKIMKYLTVYLTVICVRHMQQYNNPKPSAITNTIALDLNDKMTLIKGKITSGAVPRKWQTLAKT